MYIFLMGFLFVVLMSVMFAISIDECDYNSVNEYDNIEEDEDYL